MAPVDTKGIYDENNVLTSTTSGITSIIISSTCTSIYGTAANNNAFMGCKNTLESFTFDTNPVISSIQSYAFYGCVLLKKVDLSMCTHLKTIGQYAFFNCKEAKELKLPPNVAEIGERAFQQCFGISSLEIPDSLETLGFGAFYVCTKLASCTISDTCKLTDLTGRLFSNTALTTFYLTPIISSIDINVFEKCLSLKTIEVSPTNSWFSSKDGVLFDKKKTKLFVFPVLNCKNYILPSTVKTIGSVSFSDSKVETIDFGSTLQRIEDYVFQLSSITSITLPDTVTYIGSQFAMDCVKLTYIKLSSKLTSLPFSGFSGTSISTIDIPEGVKTIGKLCFKDCKLLKSIKLPSSLESCGGGVFSGCTDIKITFGENSNLMVTDDLFLMNIAQTEIMDYFGTEENISILSTVVKIKASAFMDKSFIKKVTFGSDNTLTTIESSAFNGCINLAEIILPKSVTEVGERAFYNCKKITSLHFYPCLRTLSFYAFELCTELEEVIFEAIAPEGNELVIETNCFKNCHKLSTVTLAEGIVAIIDNVFEGCGKLTTLEIPASLTNFGVNSFRNSGLETVTFAQGTKIANITDGAFSNARKLKSITIPETCTSLGSVAFANTAIEAITIPKNVKSIGIRCFSGCNFLKSFIVEENAKLEDLGGFVFEDCHNLSTIQCSNEFFVSEDNVLLEANRENLIAYPPASSIHFFSVPQTIKVIGPNAFYRCLNLKSVQIQDNSVQTISISAFEGCRNLALINIPSCIKNVDANAFKDCESLRCGLFIEKYEPDFISNLKSVALLPQKCFKPCSVLLSCNCKTFRFNLRLSFAFLLLTQ